LIRATKCQQFFMRINLFFMTKSSDNLAWL
jgi:hypothetical protein